MSSRDVSRGGAHSLSDMRIVLLGCRNAGKSSAGNTILGREMFDLQRCEQCIIRQGEVAGRKITLVEAPGWRRNQAVRNSSEFLKREIVLSVSRCPPGPHAVLLVLRLDVDSWRSEKNVLEGYPMLLSERVWSHTIVLFTFGDSLGDETIERYIERQEYLQGLVEKCGNRYHVFNNKKRDDCQVTQLLEKIEEMVADNRGSHVETDSNVEHEIKTKGKKKGKKSPVEDSAAASNPPPVRRPAKMTYPIPPGPLSSTHENKPGQDLESEGPQDPPISQKHKQISPPSVQNPADIRLFTPELVEKDNRNEYSFLCPQAGLFQCTVTNLVFEMKGKGEVLYRIVSWDSHVLDRIGEDVPAGPLYSMDCCKALISRLHFPHCETHVPDQEEVKLSVAHGNDGNVEIIKPQQITNTHVIIGVQGHCFFGLLRARPIQARLIRAQVLLFYKTLRSTLHMHLVPRSVPFEEVQKRHRNNMYIETSSKCELIPGKIYKPCCKTTDRDYLSQPEDETFDCDYDPNYHPTFEVLFSPEVDSITLSLLDEEGREVWKPREIRFNGPEAASSERHPQTGADFVDQHRERLIQRFVAVMEVADSLKSKDMITDEMYSNIQAKPTPQDKMRELYTCLDSAGRAAKQEFYEILERRHGLLVNDLKSPSSQAQ